MKKIFVAGHNGMVGQAIIRFLKNFSNIKIVTVNKIKIDLTNQNLVNKFFISNKFDEVYLCAAKVGGIMANKKYPGAFIYNNLMISTNVIHASFISNVKKLLFLGSSCIYPKLSKQPMKENYLMSSYLEPTNEAYAVSKIAGIKMCESYNIQYKTDFRSVMPCNLYGPGDNYHGFNSHVIPALIKKIHSAKIEKKKDLILWGTGNAIREFMYVDDMANACIKIMNISKKELNKFITPNLSHINLGTGYGVTIKKLSEIISKIINYKGQIIFDKSFPDGHPKKINNIKKQKHLGCKIKFSLNEGLKKTYNDFLKTERF
jgi:GDP-L-fucose synthase